MAGVFVTATDTEVGKTIVSALICARYQHELAVSYWKPIASGAIDERDTETVVELSGAHALPERYLLNEPLSPHLAARLDGVRIDLDQVIESFESYRDEGRALIVEGVGGIHVPMQDDGQLLSDVLPRFGLPAVVVTRSTLGTINHTLLTLEALRRRDVEIAGVVINGPENVENRRAIESFGAVEILAEVRPLEPLDRSSVEAAAESFDVSGRLMRFLQPASRPSSHL